MEAVSLPCTSCSFCEYCRGLNKCQYYNLILKVVTVLYTLNMPNIDIGSAISRSICCVPAAVLVIARPSSIPSIPAPCFLLECSLALKLGVQVFIEQIHRPQSKDTGTPLIIGVHTHAV